MNDDGILETAARWHAGQGADDMDWQAFEAWLNADPRHRDAFDGVALLDRDIDHHRDALRRLLPSVEAEPSTAKRRRARRGWAGAGAAAAVAAMLVFVTREAPSPPSPATATYLASSEPRDVRIGGARITLAPRSSVSGLHGDPSRLSLSGRAVFAVRHDPSRALVVRAEGFDIRDVGTRFEVVAGAGMVRVSVAEGEVAIRAASGGETTSVAAGHVATGLADGTIVTGVAGHVSPGGWRRGPLAYHEMPLGLVAADIARATGRPVMADRAVAGRSFSGVLAIGDAESMVRTLATLAGLEVRRQGDTIHLGNRVNP